MVCVPENMPVCHGDPKPVFSSCSSCCYASVPRGSRACVLFLFFVCFPHFFFCSSAWVTLTNLKIHWFSLLCISEYMNVLWNPSEKFEILVFLLLVPEFSHGSLRHFWLFITFSWLPLVFCPWILSFPWVGRQGICLGFWSFLFPVNGPSFPAFVCSVIFIVADENWVFWAWGNSKKNLPLLGDSLVSRWRL